MFALRGSLLSKVKTWFHKGKSDHPVFASRLKGESKFIPNICAWLPQIHGVLPFHSNTAFHLMALQTPVPFEY